MAVGGTRIPWELVVDSLGSAKHTLGTTGLYQSGVRKN
jgi:hypothetical protein